MNLDTDVTYQTVNLFISDKCLSVSFLMVHITFDEISLQFQSTNIIAPHVSSTSIFTRIVQTVLCRLKSAQHCLYNSGKDRCTQYMWANDMFPLWNRISAIFFEDTIYTSFQNSTLLFIYGLIFDIMNIQDNQSLEFE